MVSLHTGRGRVPTQGGRAGGKELRPCLTRCPECVLSFQVWADLLTPHSLSFPSQGLETGSFLLSSCSSSDRSHSVASPVLGPHHMHALYTTRECARTQRKELWAGSEGSSGPLSECCCRAA